MLLGEPMPKKLVEARIGQLVKGSDGEESTLQLVMESDPVKSFAKTDDGELSAPQRGLVAATVSVMQDKLLQLMLKHADDLRRDAILEKQFLVALVERTSSFRQQVQRLYALPLIAPTSKNGDAPGGGGDKDGRGILRHLSWGNLVGITTVILAGIAIFTTQAYAMYKDRVDVQEATIKNRDETIGEKQQEIARLDQEREKTSAELADEREKRILAEGKYTGAAQQAEEDRKKYDAMVASAAVEPVLKQNVDLLTADNARIQRELEQAQADVEKLKSTRDSSASDAKTYRDRWKAGEDEVTKLKGEIKSLNRTNDKLTAENKCWRDAGKAKC